MGIHGAVIDEGISDLILQEACGAPGSLEQERKSDMLIGEGTIDAVKNAWHAAIPQGNLVVPVYHPIAVNVLVFDVSGMDFRKRLSGRGGYFVIGIEKAQGYVACTDILLEAGTLQPIVRLGDFARFEDFVIGLRIDGPNTICQVAHRRAPR